MVAVGATVSALALTLSMIVLPWLGRVYEREQSIALRAEQLARLEAVAADRSSLELGAERLAAGREELGRRLLPGATAAVAASNLQQLLNRLAAGTGLEVQRVDAAGAPTEDGPLLRIPARLTARGDMSGLVQLLHRVQSGEPFLVVDGLRVGTGSIATRSPFMQPGPARSTGQLSISLDLYGYYGGSGEAR